MTASIATSIAGTGGFVKQDAGTLILTGMNSYTGGTTVDGGILQGHSGSLVGNIVNNASVVFDQAATGVYAGVMSGTGDLRKTGSGTLVLTGANSYRGGTTVQAGTLQGHSGSLVGTIVNNASVVFDQAVTGVYAGVMSGTGDLRKTGSGTLVLTGANSYRGGTTVQAGTLQGHSGSLVGNIVNNASVVFDQAVTGVYAGVMSGTGDLRKTGGGTLVLTGANSYRGGTTVQAGTLQGHSGSLVGNIVNNASVVFDQAGAGVYAGAMSGTGTLRKTGGGTLVLTGANSYRGGTTVQAGTLQGHSGSLVGNIVNNASVVFDQAGAGVYAGAMSGTGALRKTGGGTLVLTGANSYRGGTTVQAGTLQGHSGSLVGNFVNNASVVFDQAGAGVYAGAMSGTGALRKTGGGTLVLTGANSYRGGTTVQAGTLQGHSGSLVGNFVNKATVVFAQRDAGVFAGTISGRGAVVKRGVGTLVLTGANTYTGGTTVSGGTLQGTTTTLRGNVLNDAVVVFHQAVTGTVRGADLGLRRSREVRRREACPDRRERLHRRDTGCGRRTAWRRAQPAGYDCQQCRARVRPRWRRRLHRDTLWQRDGHQNGDWNAPALRCPRAAGSNTGRRGHAGPRRLACRLGNGRRRWHIAGWRCDTRIPRRPGSTGCEPSNGRRIGLSLRRWRPSFHRGFSVPGEPRDRERSSSSPRRWSRDSWCSEHRDRRAA